MADGAAPDHGDAVELGSPLRATLRKSLTAQQAQQTQRTRAMTTFMVAPCLDKNLPPDLRPLYVLGFMYFREPLSVSAMQRVWRERLFEIPRFASVPSTDDKGNYVWFLLDSGKIDMNDLVKELHDVKTPEQVNAFCERFYSEDLGTDLPLWRTFICNDMDDGRSMLIFAVNHAIADGVSLISSLLAVLDDSSSPPKVLAKHSTERPGFFETLSVSCGACFNALIGDQLPGDPMNRLKVKDHRHPGSDITVGMSDKIELARVKEVAKKFPGATVNDILMSVLSMAFRMYFEEFEPEVIAKQQQVRANFPISLRRPGANALEAENFGNLFAPGVLSFPLGVEDPWETVKQVKAQIDKIKISPEPLLRSKLQTGLVFSGLSMSKVWDVVLDMYGKVTVMLSNVVGPQDTAHLDGKALDELSFYAMTPIGCYIGLVSYCGQISCGMSVRRSCEPNIGNLVGTFVPAFEKLYACVMKHEQVVTSSCC